MAALRALLISDGRPGHYHLSEGIIAAATRLRPVEVTRLDVRRPRWMPGRVLSAMLNSGAGPKYILSGIYGISPSSLPACDLIVSAGGDTLAANIAAARILRASNIFYGSLRRYRSEDFALVLTSYARNAQHSNSAMTLKPSKLDPDALGLPTARAAGAPPAIVGLLVGGNSGGFAYTAADWSRLVTLIEEAHRRLKTRWIVSNSRRTDPAASDAIAQLAVRSDGPLVEFIDVRRAGAGTLASLLARSEAIAVTADSSSMVSEAVWARRPVLALMPADATFDADEQSYRNYLEREGWVVTLALADATPEALAASLASVRPLGANPLDALAGLLRARLPQVFNAGA